MPINSSTDFTTSITPNIGVAHLLASLVPPTIHPIISTIYGFSSGLKLPTNGIPIIDIIENPSKCLLLKNIFDPTDLEMELDFDLVIKDV